MRLLVALEYRYVRGPDGAVRARAARDYAFWQRYLEVFDEVRVLARVADVAEDVSDVSLAEGDGVTFEPLPAYVGPWQYLPRAAELQWRIHRAVGRADAILLRVPGIIGTQAWLAARVQGAPFGLEVVGDPWDALAAGTRMTVLRPLIRRGFAAALRAQCRGASAVAYVTRETLQRRYPAAADAFTSYYSSVELSADALVAEPRTFEPADRARLGLVAVGTMTVAYKGYDVLLRALALIPPDERPSLTIVGGGRLREDYQRLAGELGVGDDVRFTGQLPPGTAVRDELDLADVFVMPSLTEGLPRAMIEAMARGLPCVGSHVGGIPELLDASQLVEPGDAAALAGHLRRLLGDPERLAQASARNLEEARDYQSTRLQARRRAFYRELAARS